MKHLFTNIDTLAVLFKAVFLKNILGSVNAIIWR